MNQNYILITETDFNRIRKQIRDIQWKEDNNNNNNNCSQHNGRGMGQKNSMQKIGGKGEQLIKTSNKKIIFSSSDDELNRKVLEKEKIDILLISQKNRNDFQKQRNSGFNQVLAKLAKKNSVAIGINLDEIIESSSSEKQKILARVKQNIKLCNKNKVQMKFIAQDSKNERNIYDLRALGSVLGMPTWMMKKL